MSDDINSGKSTEKPQSQDDRNQATPTMASPDAAVRGAPASIGRYRILRLLGQGGMGAVYEAEQEQPRRRVALKVIKAGWAKPELLRRFEIESQSLGRLHHPGIAQIYEAGSADTGFGPQPFFAMELIQGKPLCQYADAQHLNTRQRLQLMIRVCEAVEHAHQRGIIHRDLKPSNILVDETGQPKILDFGVARAMDSDAQATQQTGVGEIVGTLAYMSPEQVLADPLALDTRSDVYALGVILYELLAGRLPYKLNPQLHEAVRTIQDTDPAPLSTINRAYRADIETIVAKALEKDKARRYSSAAELAADIRRYLDDQPIAAKPASTIYQLKKFARRQKALVVGVAAVFLALVIGIVATSWEAVQARRAQRIALQQSAIAQAVNDFLQNDLLTQATAVGQAATRARPDPDLKVRTALDRAAARIGQEFTRQPAVEGAIRDTIGQSYLDLGIYPEAQTQLERALELQTQVLGADNVKTAKTRSRLGGISYLEAKYAAAEADFKQALEVQRRALGTPNPDTLYSMNGLASVYLHEGKYMQSEAMYAETLENRRRTLGAEHPDTLKVMGNLAMAYNAEGKYAQAEELYKQDIGIQRRLLGPDDPALLFNLNNLANLYTEQGKYPEAEVLQSEAYETRRKILGAEHPDTLASMGNLAGIYDLEGKYQQAEALFSKNVEIRKRVLGAEHPDTLASMSDLASVYAAERKYAQAEALFNQTYDSSKRVLGAEHPETVGILSTFVTMYLEEGKFAQAETYGVQVLAGRRHTLGSRHPDTIFSMNDLAFAYVQEGKFAQAEALEREALEASQETVPDDLERYRAEMLLGASLAGEKKFAESEPLLTEGYQGIEARKDRIAAPDQYQAQMDRERVVKMYEAWGKPEKAQQWTKK